MRARAVLLRAGSPFLQLWWRIRKPTTSGVKALLRRPDGRFLVVRHSYTDTRRWALPGGGYNPARETPAQAAAREVHEELGLLVPPEIAEARWVKDVQELGDAPLSKWLLAALIK
ncbi:NUDIX domain-containing protein [Kribbella sp. NPDC051936]|uniref:NUDIX hydrolase n=1 Tax=Kribbella sp. NPDC051936 TaxID=3154946 RepID=UPI003437CED0